MANRRPFQPFGHYQYHRRLRSTCNSNSSIQLTPEIYSDSILLLKRGPPRIYYYSYSCQVAPVQSYVSEVIFFPKVVAQKHVSIILHYPAPNNDRPRTMYKDCFCFVPRCKIQYPSKRKVLTQNRRMELFRSGLNIHPGKRPRLYKSSVYLTPKAFSVAGLEARCFEESLHLKA